MSDYKFLYVGIDVSKASNQVYAMDSDEKKFLSFSSPNNSEGASVIEKRLFDVLVKFSFTDVVVILESTGMYSYHIAVFLAASELLSKFNVLVFNINPKTSCNYRKTFCDMDKTDPKDSYLLADMARSGKYKQFTPVRGSQKLALQRLTRHRKHVSELIGREKCYVLNNIFLKFSAFDSKIDGKSVFSDTFSASATEILSQFKTPEEIENSSIEDLVAILAKASKNRFENTVEVANLLKKCARLSYRLDKAAYDPINIAIASSLCLIRTFEKQLDAIDKEILNLVKGLQSNEYASLISIPGIGPVFAAGILSEIGSVKQFANDSALAKYAGITWRTKQSGKFAADETPMTKTGNNYLRYYLLEATSMAILHNPEYRAYYLKKREEVTTHQHTRAVALTSRKLIRLIYGLVSKDQLFTKV